MMEEPVRKDRKGNWRGIALPKTDLPPSCILCIKELDREEPAICWRRLYQDYSEGGGGLTTFVSVTNGELFPLCKKHAFPPPWKD